MRGLVATLRGALAAAAAKPGALAAQLTTMVANDLGWVLFWVLFFRKVGELRGWDGDRVLVLLAVLSGAAGITLGLLANARHIGSMAVDGQLDEALRLPVHPLAYLLVRRVEPVNLGDLVFGFVLFAVVGDPTPLRMLGFAGAILAATTVFTSFLVLTGSTAFFLGRGEGGELGLRAIIVFGTYPVDVFAGAVKAVLYTAIPAAFISTVPAQMLDSFDATRAAWLVAVSVGFAVAAWLAFRLGLRHYTSGSVWTQT